MKRHLALLGLVAAIALPGIACAADLIVDEAPLQSIDETAWDWSGVYIGAHAGYAWGEAGVIESPDNIVGDISGPIIGVFGGVNFQEGGLVYGLEGDAGIADVAGVGVPVIDPEEDYSYNLNWNAHARGRVGFATGQLLVFAAGGLAVASHTLSEEYDGGGVGSDTQVHVGWTIGAGLELALTDNVAVRAEYLYDDYGTKTYRFENAETYDAFLTAHTVRVGVSVGF